MEKNGKRVLGIFLLLIMLFTLVPSPNIFVMAEEEEGAVVESEAALEEQIVAIADEILSDLGTDDGAIEKDAETISDGTPDEEVTVESVAAEDETSGEQESAEIPEEPAEEPAAQTEEELVSYSAEVSGFVVSAKAGSNAFDVPVRLVASVLSQDDTAYQDAEGALADSGKQYDGMIALDIHFEDENGNEVEPIGNVSVSIQVKKEVIKEAAEDTTQIVPETVEVNHITTDENGAAKAETVADVAQETEGTVSVTTKSEDVEQIDSDFTVDGFSTFVITWTNASGDKQNATIFWGHLEGDAFIEMDTEELVSLDTTAATVSLDNAYSEYYSMGATYYPDETLQNGVDITYTLYKNGSSWQYEQIVTDADENITYVKHDLTNGSVIRVLYTKPSESHPHTPEDSSDEIPTPITTKNVTVNDDGSATITLDVLGKEIKEDNSHYANVLVILDATRSMRGSKWTNAKAAMKALIETLSEGENAGNAGKIDYALVTFGRSATVVQNWTKNNATFKTTCANLSMVSTSGTNWEAGMRGGLYGVLNTYPEGETADNHDPTYVIFLTDGDPNVYYQSGSTTNYTDTGTTEGYGQDAGISATYSKDEAKRIATLVGGNLYGIYCGDSGTTPSGASYYRLVDVIQGQGQGGKKTIAANADTIESEFKAIAQTILDGMGANDVSVDDGIPELSHASAMTSGDVSGFIYEISTDGTNYTTWAEAPGASYSQANGVTWDLSKAGTLTAGTHYRLTFKVWPSQEALDLIANLNNGTVKWGDLDDEVQSQISKNGNSYTLKTNTHLNQTYSFKGVTYTDPVELVSGDMPLKSVYMDVKKIWNDSINTRNRANEVEFYLLVDGKYYQKDGSLSAMLTGNEYILYTRDANILKLENDSRKEWKDTVSIALGFMEVSGETVEVLESGHSYSLVEKAAHSWKLNKDSDGNVTGYRLDGDGNKIDDYTSYSMEFKSQVIRPMIINGTPTYLVQVGSDDHVVTSSDTTYTIDGTQYYVLSVPTGENATVSGVNNKTPELDITKSISEKSVTDKTDAELDEETFTYKVTFIFPKGSDAAGVGYWIYEPSTSDDAWKLPEYDDLTDYQPDGYVSGMKFYGESSTSIWGDSTPNTSSGSVTQTVTVTIHRTDVVRFTNLPVGTTYTIVEDKANGDTLTKEGYTVESITAYGEATADKGSATITGTVTTPNTRYYNRYTNVLKAVDVYPSVTKKLEGYDWIDGVNYTFTITTDPSTNPMPEKTTVTVSSKDKLTGEFGRIRFTEAGTYTYTITETKAGEVVDGILYGTAETFTVTVTEDSTGKLTVTGVEGTNTTYTASTGKTDTTITNKIAETEVNAKKEWLNADGTTTAPNGASVVFELFADGVTTNKTVTLDGTADENGETAEWTATFSGLPKYTVTDGVAKEITYTVKEKTGYPGYTASTTDGVPSGGTITNIQDKLDITAEKKWVNADGSTTPPAGAKITITLLADGTAAGTVELDGTVDTNGEDSAWKASFKNLPKYKLGTTTEINYTVSETVTYPGYTPSVETGNVIVNTQEKTSASAVKAWKNADGGTTAPDGATVTFTLYADKEKTSYTVTLDGTAETTAPTTTAGYENAAWTATFVNLPKYKTGTTIEIVYTIEETTGWTGYTASGSPAANGGTITNSQETTEASASKAWKNADGTTAAPSGASVVFTLYADNVATTKTITLDGTTDSNGEAVAWTATFTSLAKYKADGKTPIVYTVAETTTWPGYTASTKDAVASGSTITNTQDSTKANAKKEWKNADGTTAAPAGAKVTFTLYADTDETSYTVELDGTAETTVPVKTGGYESEAWVATFVNLPKSKVVDGEAVDIVYTVAETGTQVGYTASTSDPVASGETITNTQVSTEVSATKEWKNADGTTKAPADAKVTFTLYADNTATTKTVTLDGTVDDKGESEAWKATFTGLAQYTADGKAITYTVVESGTWPGYTASGSPASNGGTITNTQDETNANARKAWKNADGTTAAPNGATVVYTLFADGEATDYTVTLTGTAGTEPDKTGGYESAAWTAMFVHLPKYEDGTTTPITYKVKETTGYPGYTADKTGEVASGELITNTQETTEVEVDKKWVNADGNGTWPTRVTVSIQLTADNEAVDGKTATLSADQTSYKFTSLPKYKVVDGEEVEIKYSVEEAKVAGYTTEVGDLTEGKITVTNTQKTTEVEVDKKWVNADGSETWPSGVTVTVQLTADKEAVAGKTATLSANKTSYKFTNLPKYQADGETEIAYSVKEVEVPGYTSTVGKLTGGKITVTNTQETTEVEVEKTWANADGSKTWPDGVTVTVQLTAGGTDVSGKTLTLSASKTSDKFTSLPKYQADGKTEIKYSVKEVEVAGYTSAVGSLTNGKITVTNTQETTELEVNKKWVNADGNDTWPTGVTVSLQLTADGEAVTGKTATLSADQTSYKFTSLPKYKVVDGEEVEIKYSVEEAKVAGYTTEVGDLTEGKITVTNTQKTTEVEVDKKWVNADGSETWPAGVTVSIQLTADKEAVAGKTATLNADQTSYKFTSLPKYKVVDGKEVEIEYSVEEAKVAGYTTEVGDLTEGKTTVTNTQETVEVIVTKVWEDQDDAHGLRPDSIIINLLADGEQLNRAVLDGKVDGEDEAGYEKKAWVATFSSLPKYQADGTTKIKYTVTENAVQGYITVIELKAEEADAVEETENVTETAEAETAESETSETEDTETETEKDGPIEYTVTNTLISLEITKEVQNLFDAGGTSNATFVFEVKIGTKYHNYAAIIFDGKAGTDSTVLYGLPYEEGDTITVEEVYTAGHKLVSQTAVTWDGEDKIFKVSFVNTYNNTPGYGSGIINEYSHDEKGNPVVTNQSKQNTVS